jgi:hypothetical protein
MGSSRPAAKVPRGLHDVRTHGAGVKHYHHHVTGALRSQLPQLKPPSRTRPQPDHPCRRARVTDRRSPRPPRLLGRHLRPRARRHLPGSPALRTEHSTTTTPHLGYCPDCEYLGEQPDTPPEHNHVQAHLTSALVATVVILTAIAPLATDMYVCAFPRVADDLGGTATQAQLTLPASSSACPSAAGWRTCVGPAQAPPAAARRRPGHGARVGRLRGDTNPRRDDGGPLRAGLFRRLSHGRRPGRHRRPRHRSPSSAGAERHRRRRRHRPDHRTACSAPSSLSSRTGACRSWSSSPRAGDDRLRAAAAPETLPLKPPPRRRAARLRPRQPSGDAQPALRQLGGP